MTLLDKLPTMSDADLANLLANAVRLSESGTKRQQEEAAQLLPALSEEAESRSARAKEAAAAKKAARPKTSRRKAAVAATADADASTEVA
jgi:hypothetical protein